MKWFIQLQELSKQCTKKIYEQLGQKPNLMKEIEQNIHNLQEEMIKHHPPKGKLDEKHTLFNEAADIFQKLKSDIQKYELRWHQKLITLEEVGLKEAQRIMSSLPATTKLISEGLREDEETLKYLWETSKNRSQTNSSVTIQDQLKILEQKNQFWNQVLEEIGKQKNNQKLNEQECCQQEKQQISNKDNVYKEEKKHHCMCH